MVKFANIILIIKQFYYFSLNLELKHGIVDKVIYQWQLGLRACECTILNSCLTGILLILADISHFSTTLKFIKYI